MTNDRIKVTSKKCSDQKHYFRSYVILIGGYRTLYWGKYNSHYIRYDTKLSLSLTRDKYLKDR